MVSSLEIAQKAELQPITKIAEKIGIIPDELESFGHFIAKINLSILQRLKDRPDGKIVLVTGITPTRYGEGKTVHTIGTAQALAQIGVKSCSMKNQRNFKSASAQCQHVARARGSQTTETWSRFSKS